MKINSISFSGLKGQTGDLALNGLDVFVGPNGSGKTTRLLSAVIGLLGYDPDPSRGSKPASTLELAGEDAITINVSLDGGTSFTRQFFRNKSGACTHKRFVFGEPELGNTEAEDRIQSMVGHFPMMFNPQSFLAMTPDARREVLRPFLPDDGRDPWMDVAVEAYRQALGAGAVGAILEHAFNADSFDTLDVDAAGAFFESCKDAIAKSDPRLANRTKKALDDLSSDVRGETPDVYMARAIMWIKDRTKTARAAQKNAEAATRGLTGQKADAHQAAAGLAQLQAEVAAMDGANLQAERNLAVAIEAERAIRQREDRIGVVRLQRKKLANGVDIGAMKKKVESLSADVDAAKNTHAGTTHALSSSTDSEDQASAQITISTLLATKELITAKDHALHHENSSADTQRCPKCGHEFTPGASVKDEKAALAAELQVVYSDLDAAQRAERYAASALAFGKRCLENAETGLSEAEAKLASAKHAMEIAEANEASRGERLAETGEEILDLQRQNQAAACVDISIMQAEITGITASLNKKRDLLQAAHHAQGILEQIERSVLAGIDADVDVSVAKTLASAIAAVRNAKTDGLVDKITKRANELLFAINPDLKMGVILEGPGGKQIFDLTLTQNGVERPLSTLSGGETVLVASVALATTLIDLASPPCRLLAIEAAELDGANLAALLNGARAMQSAGYLDNVLVASWATPDPLPEGWALHNMGQGS